ncbi:MAG: YCF48-related protein [Ignavibacteria bacterium]
MKILFAILILFLNCTIALTQSSWFFINPYPDAQSINSIYFMDINTGFISGYDGRILKTTNAGINWIYSNLDLSLSVNQLSFINNSTGFVLTNKQIYKTTNMGVNWQSKLSITMDNLTSFSFPSNSLGYISSSAGLIYRTTNGGESWVQISNSSVQNIKICYADSLTGFAITNNIQPNSLIYRTSDGGTTWNSRNFSSGDTTVEFKKIRFINENTGFALAIKYRSIFPGGWSRAEIYQTTDKGLNWISLTYINSVSPNNIEFSNNINGLLTTTNGIYRTTNSGSSWQSVFSDYTKTFTSLYLIKNTNMCYAGGNTGLFMSSTNFGTNWTNFSSSRLNSSKDILSSSFIDENTGFIVGNQGLFAKTTNAGNNWTIVNSLPNFRFNSTSFTSALTGYTVGFAKDTVYKTIDGGASWQHTCSYTNALSLYHIQFVNSVTGYASGYPGKIIKTTNGGVNWISLSTTIGSDLLSLYFINDLTGYITSSMGNLLITTDGGNSFSYQFFGTSTYLWCVIFINANTGFMSTANGEIYRTTNAGNNWTIHSTGTTQQINYIDFINENTGFAVGNGVYKTTNGGLNWNRQIFFSFEYFLWSISITTPNIIYAFGDGGAILKTTNGGSIFINNINKEIPSGYSLNQNYPNPFNPTTKIRFDVINGFPVRASGNDKVVLKVYDVMGREVQTLVNESLKPGTYEVSFDGSPLTSGVYFYKLITGGFTETKKMLMIK